MHRRSMPGAAGTMLCCGGLLPGEVHQIGDFGAGGKPAISQSAGNGGRDGVVIRGGKLGGEFIDDVP